MYSLSEFLCPLKCACSPESIQDAYETDISFTFPWKNVLTQIIRVTSKQIYQSMLSMDSKSW